MKADKKELGPDSGKICGHNACTSDAELYISLNGYGIYSCSDHENQAETKLKEVIKARE